MAHKVKLNESNSTRVSAEDLHRQLSMIFQAVETPENHADIAAKVLVSASVRGVDTHGVSQVIGYSEAIENGFFTVPQETTVITESETTAYLVPVMGLALYPPMRGWKSRSVRRRSMDSGWLVSEMVTMLEWWRITR
ncbi:MAG: hypothetical protein Ct9H300mP19_12270 [Dehalococcoidia bacterium]|nr:MAG: hypothetical protein Ct9H300mP19_12270 [Dehalococcoidia bacterium]